MKLVYWKRLHMVFVGFIVIFSSFAIGYYHESVHQEIYKHYGIESEIYMLEYFPHFATVPVPDSNISLCDDYCRLAHNQNEIFGYHMMIEFLFMMIMLYLIWLEVMI